MTKEEFITERTRIISEMLDNPDKYGLYPTTRCFTELDLLYDKIILSLKSQLSEAGKEKKEGWTCPRCGKIHSYLSLTCDCPPKTYTANTYEGAEAGEEKKLTEKQKQKICNLIEKSLNSVRLKNYKTDDDDNLPLVDLLSTGETILEGKEEIENIVEQIFFDMDDWEI